MFYTCILIYGPCEDSFSFGEYRTKVVVSFKSHSVCSACASSLWPANTSFSHAFRGICWACRENDISLGKNYVVCAFPSDTIVRCLTLYQCWSLIKFTYSMCCTVGWCGSVLVREKSTYKKEIFILIVIFCLVFLRLCICLLKYLIRPGLPSVLGKNPKNMSSFLQANFEYFFEKEPKHCPVEVHTTECVSVDGQLY